MKKITFIPAKNSLKYTEKLKVAVYCKNIRLKPL